MSAREEKARNDLAPPFSLLSLPVRVPPPTALSSVQVTRDHTPDPPLTGRGENLQNHCLTIHKYLSIILIPPRLYNYQNISNLLSTASLNPLKYVVSSRLVHNGLMILVNLLDSIVCIYFFMWD